MRGTFAILLLLPTLQFLMSVGADSGSCDISDNEVLDCLPDESSGQQGCLSRGCCWRPHGAQNAPWCFYPKDYPAGMYRLQHRNVLHSSNSSTEDGFHDNIQKTIPNPKWPRDVLNLQVQVTYLTARVARIRIIDPATSRFEVPLELNIEGLRQKHRHLTRNYFVSSSSSEQQRYGLRIIRQSDKSVLFNSEDLAGPSLVYTDQFLQLSTRLPSDTIYGIGERENNFLRRVDSWSILGLYSRDTVPRPDANLYGVHNFLLGMIANPQGAPGNSTAYGYFFLNSNAQEVILQPTPAITYRTIGGVLDLFIFTADHPKDVVSDYWTLIGPPFLPPQWALGMHLCRWGFYDTNHMSLTMRRNLEHQMPHDAMWADIDYMDRFLDWTVDPNRWSGLGNEVRYMREKLGKRFVMVVDPGVGSEFAGRYPVYDDGMAMGVFINNSDNSEPIVGKVWPGLTVFPDFTNPRTLSWWAKHMKLFHDQVPFSGLWIDMNEPSNFYYGSTKGCGGNQWDEPPYTPHIDFRNINQLTLCASARQVAGRLYEMHSLYGHFEAKVSYEAMRQVMPGKERPFILSRSTFAGSGKYTAHWTGDNYADWNNLYHSVVQILNFNLYGIPMTGADICGFREPTNEELCTRWMQVGAFYPFMRNHNDNHSPDKDPGAWNEVARNRMRAALRLRYSMLPYLYTLMHRATTRQEPVFQPLFFFYPNVPEIFALDTQFMLGPSLMVAPVFGPGATQRDVYFPSESWCDVHSLEWQVYRGEWRPVVLTMDHIPVYIRGGHVLSFQGWRDSAPANATTTEAYRQLPYTFLACVNMDGMAQGELVVDDGVTLDTITFKRYNLLKYHVDTRRGEANFNVHYRGWQPVEGETSTVVPLSSLVVLGVPWRPTHVDITVNGPTTSYQKATNFTFERNVLHIAVDQVDFMKTSVNNVFIKWSY